MIYGIKSGLPFQANTRIVYKDHEISIAMDDSCGVMSNLCRTDIRVFKDDKDVTESFFSYTPSSAEDLFYIMHQIDRRATPGL